MCRCKSKICVWSDCSATSLAQYLGRFRREAFHGLEASGYVDARIDPATVRRSGRTRQPTYEQEFKPAVVTATAECAPAPATVPLDFDTRHRREHRLICRSMTSLSIADRLLTSSAGVASLLLIGPTGPATLCREDEESEWESEDEEPGVRHGEEFQVQQATWLVTL